MGVSATLGNSAAIGCAGLGYLLLVPDAFWWKCSIHQSTGWLCPGCGGQRWLFAILQGDFAAAWQANSLLFAAPVLIGFGFLLQRAKTSNPWLLTYIIFMGLVTLGFALYRNLSQPT